MKFSEIAYPLVWPDQWSRTGYRLGGHKTMTRAQARDLLTTAATNITTTFVISCSVSRTTQGKISGSGPEPLDPGVALYFKWQHRIYVIPCDRYAHVANNLKAIGQFVASVDDFTASSGVNRARILQAFLLHPEPPIPSQQITTPSKWQQALYVTPNAPWEVVEASYRKLATLYHPDKGGDSRKMQQLNLAYENAKQAYKR